MDLVDRFQEKMKHNKSVTERKQKRADESEVGKFTQEKLMDQSIESKVTKLVAITTFLTNAPEMGKNKLKERLSKMMLVMARSDKYIIHELVPVMQSSLMLARIKMLLPYLTKAWA